MRSGLVRIVVAVAAALLMLAAMPAGALAQQADAAPPPEKVKQLLDLLNDPDVKSWLQSRPAAPAAPESSPAADGLTEVEARIRNHIGALKTALVSFPQQLANATRAASADVNSGRPGTVLFILAVLIAVGYGAERLFRHLLHRARRDAPGGAAEQPLRLLTDLVPLLVFTLASAGLFLAFDWPPLLRKVVLTFLAAVILFRLVRTVARLLLSPQGADPARPPRMVDTDDASARFWFSRVQMFAAIFFAGWAIASLMPSLGFTREARQLVAYAFGLGLLAVSIDCVWRRPHFRAAPSPMKGWLLTFYLIILWFVWVAELVGLLWLGIYALLLPKAVSGVGRIADTLAGGHGSTTLWAMITRVLIVRGARALVIALAVAWLTYVWQLTAAAVGESETARRVVGGLLNGIIILLVADLLWQLSKALIAHRMEVTAEQGGTPEEMARRGRLRTLLPIFRNALGVFIAIVAVLTILSGMGIAIAPLIAGAGIFGVAIGFGSQTLVKDIISGVFFMLDDAFRVGEYIQSGSYKGTVEGFSLRSVRLRHQRGPIFTVPFGQLGAVQNMSRDWVIEKMTLTVTYDSDVEQARKIVKKIGQELAQDPEFAENTLSPLKMQGVDSFGESGIVLRMKLMTKPGTQFTIKRKALMMIKKAFDENGIKLATPTVQVSGGAEEATAAAAQETRRRRRKATELAAAGE
ncbi:mechanosensitive ion channel family protein [Mesorhizobium ephedrae]|uniref:Mechanosensitive ion channel family protein n=1 Tax=Kumtagia ephedrae TaxID=2116701 RepID=A0A2P7RSH9_9HYPH|nr:mechanosensitive ion channel family protein [Mesorhizobium ephedrae]